MQPDLGDAIVTRRADGAIAIAVWNYAAPGQSGPVKQVHIALEGWNGSPRFHVELVDADHGSALSAWQAMGRPAYPTQKQYKLLRRSPSAIENRIGATFTLRRPGLALVEVKLVRRSSEILCCHSGRAGCSRFGLSAADGPQKTPALSPARPRFRRRSGTPRLHVFLGTGRPWAPAWSWIRSSADGGRAKGPSRDIASIAATGFGLTAICIGAEHGGSPG